MIKKFLLLNITIVGFILLFRVCSLLVESKTALKWPQAKGEVVSSLLVIKPSSQFINFEKVPAKLYGADIQYEYTVDDGRYASSRVSFIDAEIKDLKSALYVMNKYRRQHNVTVYYNPKDPQQSVLEPANIGDISIQLIVGWVFAVLGLFALFQKTTEFNVRGVDSYFYKGQSYQKQGRYDEALNEFNKIVEINPGVAMGYYGRGGAYLKLKKWDEAVADFNQALRITPNDPSIYFNRANAYLGKHEWNPAWEDLQKAMEMGYPVSKEIVDDVKRSL